jgi:hypothetical protein
VTDEREQEKADLEAITAATAELVHALSVLYAMFHLDDPALMTLFWEAHEIALEEANR